MTTIAWDGVVLASDTQSTTGDILCSLKEKKIFQPKENEMWNINGEKIQAFGAAGDCGCETAIIEHLVTGMNYKSDFPEVMSFSAIAIVGKNISYLIFKEKDKKTASISLHRDFFSVGSGSVIARTAMSLGRNAIEAVKVAIDMDVYSGGGVNPYRIE